jgi:Holliday junction resolvase RusA-like endonuclease
MTCYRFVVPGTAKTERKRQRPFVDKTGHPRAGPRTDEPDRKSWKERVVIFALQAGIKPLAGPLRVRMVVRTRKPESWPKSPTKRNPWPWCPWKKPDAENYLKPFCDALTGIAWYDDAQIVELGIVKEFGPADEVEIVIEEVALLPSGPAGD